MAKHSVIDEIAALIPASQSGMPWYRKLSREHEEIVKPILAAWKAGKFGRRKMPAAKAISAYLMKQGIEIGAQGVLGWLTKGE